MGRLPLIGILVVVLAALAAPPLSSARVLQSTSRTDTPIGAPADQARHLIAYVRPGTSVALHSRPFGPVVDTVSSTTQFGSPQTLSVVQTRNGRWLGVTQVGLGNGRLGWVDAAAGDLRYTTTPLEIDVDLSTRTLTVRRGTDVLREMLVGIGRPDTPTPTGRFAVTDELNGASYSSAAYGCCILALSATQPNLPAGWTGGDRIAIHGTSSSSDFGHAVSTGCIHASEADLRYLMQWIPLGTPVVIQQ
ncbi:MAG TPA: L,D-transpeptidase [Gaiellaceae bacterium]|nr:L,D-transpeptidase [Gaiellaceae bacterium]